MTQPAMLISYNPATRKGSVTDLSEKETKLSLDEITKRFKLDRTPYVFVPATQNRQKFWADFKSNLSTWPRKPYQILTYFYAYAKMRIIKKTFISTGDFIMLSQELPALRGVDFAVREKKRPKPKTKNKAKAKTKNEKVEPQQSEDLILNSKKQEKEEPILMVEIFNASDHNGLAYDVTNYLRTLHNKGIFKVDVINYTTASERRNTTKIIGLTKRLEALKELSKHLGLVNKEIYYMEDKNAISDARIYLGEDFKLPKAAK